MTTPIEQPRMIAWLLRWAAENEIVRAILLTSTRAIPGAKVDPYSDYDVILVLQDIRPYFESRAWLADFGPVLAVYQDPLEPELGVLRSGYVVQYEDGLKIDFTLWPVEIMLAVAASSKLPLELDAGYQVLLDKDTLCDGLPRPTYTAYIPKPPDEAAYLTTVELLFLNAAYVAKYLRRDDLVGAKHVMDYYLRQEDLIPMLEWRVQVDHGWRVKPGPYGRNLKQRLTSDWWEAYEQTYSGHVLEDNWRALWNAIELFRLAAREVGDRLGFQYPEELHQRGCAYLKRVQES